jgi:hypothetical protein
MFLSRWIHKNSSIWFSLLYLNKYRVSIVNYVAVFAALISLNIQRDARSLFCADKAHYERYGYFRVEIL